MLLTVWCMTTIHKIVYIQDLWSTNNSRVWRSHVTGASDGLFDQSHAHFCESILKWYSDPITSLDKPWGFQDVESPRFQYNRHTKVLRLSALHTGHLYPPGNIPGTHFYYRLSRPQGHSAAGSIMSIKKNPSDTIRNRTHELLACTAVPQPTVPCVPKAILQCCDNSHWLRQQRTSISIMMTSFM